MYGLYLDFFLTGIGLGILCASLVLRLITTYIVLAGNDLTMKEKVFIAISWLPKATVQVSLKCIDKNLQ